MSKVISLLIIIALISLSISVATPAIYADEMPEPLNVTPIKEANVGQASISDINYTYKIISNSEFDLADLELEDDKIVSITLPADSLTTTSNMTATAVYTVAIEDYRDSAPETVNEAKLAGTLSDNSSFSDITTDTASLNKDNASLTVNKEADRDTATLNDIIEYTYTVENNGDVEITDLLLKDDKLGIIPLVDGDVTITSLKPSESITATAKYKVKLKDLLAGSIKNTAIAEGKDLIGNPVSATSEQVTVSTGIITSLLTKAQILEQRGVPGKGIDKAPGLQKPFNPKSQAAEHAGKKIKKQNTEQNTNQEMNGNINRNRNKNQHQEMNNQGNLEQNRNHEMNGNAEQNKNKKNKK